MIALNILGKAVDWEYLEANPACGVSQQQEEAAEVVVLREEEIGQLLNLCPAHIKPVVIVALHTCLRRGKLLNLQWRDIEFDTGDKGFVMVRKSKNYDIRYILMNTLVRETLMTMPRNITCGREESPRHFGDCCPIYRPFY